MNIHDKFYYIGQEKDLRGIIWSASNVTDLSLLTGYTPKGIKYIKITDLSLLQFLYNDTPKYGFNDIVSFFYNGEYVDGVVGKLVYSYTNKPHEYEVIVDGGNSYLISQDLLIKLDRTKLLDSSLTTREHVHNVAKNLNSMATMLINRGTIHDESKYSDPEKTLLDAMEYVNKNEGNATYGSPEYKRRTAILKPMLKHHYANNSHHPEHYENGVYGMTLINKVEMLCDWQAASIRNNDPEMFITAACERYNISDQLKKVFENTASMMGWKYR